MKTWYPMHPLIMLIFCYKLCFKKENIEQICIKEKGYSNKLLSNLIPILFSRNRLVSTLKKCMYSNETL